MRKLRFCAILGLLFLATPSLGDVAQPDASARPVQAFYDTLTETMKQAKQLGIQGRFNKLKPVVEQSFDIPAMTGLAVGPSWSTLSVPDRNALIQSFERMTVANYARNFDGYSGERFVVDPKPVARGDERLVQTRLEVPKGEPVPFIYRMHQADGSWKVVDIFLNGYVSELATRRSDFSATLASKGPRGLVKQIDALSDKLMSGN